MHRGSFSIPTSSSRLCAPATGASFRLLSLIDSGRFTAGVSVPLVLEYEPLPKGSSSPSALTATAVGDVIDYICRVAEHHKVYYLWRPLLRDPKDDIVLELAVSSGAEVIVTYNKADFRGAEQFGPEDTITAAVLGGT